MTLRPLTGLLVSALAVWCVAIPAAAATATSAPAATPAPDAMANSATPVIDTLAGTAGVERYLLTASPASLLSAIGPTSRAAFAAALRPKHWSQGDALWPVLMTGAVQTRRETGTTGTTLWFNPVFDGGLAVRWRHDPDGWTAVDVAPVLGEDLRGRPVPKKLGHGELRWTHRSPSLADALSAFQSETARAIASDRWLSVFRASQPNRDRRAKILFTRAAAATLSLRVMGKQAGYGDALHDAHLALAEDDPAKGPLDDSLKQALAKMGEAGRLTLRPVAALRRPDGWSVVLQSPNAVGAVWFAHFADPASGGTAKAAAFSVVPIIAPSPRASAAMENTQ
jgi:hypothetical protein